MTSYSRSAHANPQPDVQAAPGDVALRIGRQAVPHLLLFFGSIVLMGLPMFRIDRRRRLVTVVTTSLLLVAMAYAISMGVG